MYYLLMPSLMQRTALIEHMRACQIMLVFHYVPLHASPAGRQLCRTSGALPVTENLANRLVRLPLWPDMKKNQTEIINCMKKFFEKKS